MKAALLLFCLAGCAPAVGVVRTWRDLAEQPRLDLGGGVTARVGVDRLRTQRYGAVHLYCLSEGFTPPRQWRGQPLGPLVLLDDTQSITEQESGIATRDPRLFLLLLPLTESRKAVLAMPDGRRVLEFELEATAIETPPWMPFDLPSTLLQELRVQDPKEPGLVHGGLANAAAGIALPASCGMAPFAAPKDLDSLLPQLLPESPTEGFVLRRTGARLRLDSPTPFLVYRPDFHFLGRWWVNGRPFVPAPDRVYEAQNGIVIEGKALELDLEFVPARLGAKPGDRIGLQLWYGDEGWAFVNGGGSLAHREGPPRAWLTNRIEWVAGSR